MQTLTKNLPIVRQLEMSGSSPKGLSDVSILTEGEADGHGCYIDDKTLAQFMALTLGKTIPSYLTHAGAIDNNGSPNDRLGNEIGMFSGFYRDQSGPAQQVRAKNFKFLDSFVNNQTPVYSTIVSLAKDYPDKLGISPVMMTKMVWCMPDGTEVPAVDDDDMDEMAARAVRPMPSLRILSIKSCDFVQQPAANAALFSAKVDGKTNNNPMSETILLSKHNEALAAKDGEIKTLSAQHKDAITALETKHKETVTALESKVNELTSQHAKIAEEARGLQTALAAKTKEAEDAAKYDMRKAGGEALEMALQSRADKIPAPAAKDHEKWAQYTALCELTKDDRGNVIGTKETSAAKRFRELHLSRK